MATSKHTAARLDVAALRRELDTYRRTIIVASAALQSVDDGPGVAFDVSLLLQNAVSTPLGELVGRL